MPEFLTGAFEHFQVTDTVDILIVSALIYMVLVWFKQTRAAFILVGILILGAVYLLARRHELYLTVVIFQGFFAVLLVALVVIFQEELRHFFERIAIWGLTYRRMPSAATASIEILMRTLSDFSANKIGSLMVIAGRDPLDRHLEGGFNLHGEVSDALLHSLFDPHSLGHDGAVVINRNRVEKFACHLPLSQDFAKTRRHGTRHAAALGLSERTDALCLVVSEETGRISFARDGKIKSMDSVGRLGPALENFFRDRFPYRGRRIWLSLITRNLREKAIAIFLALVLWFAFGQRAELISRDFTVPIRYDRLQADLYIKEPYRQETVVTLSGYERSFHLFDSEELTVVIDLGGVEAAGEEVIPFLEEHISHPEAIQVQKVDPPLVRLRIGKFAVFSLKVEPDITGALPEGWKLRSLKVSPDKVDVYSSDNKDVRDLALQTEPVILDGITESRTVRVPLVIPPGIRSADEALTDVEIAISVEPSSDG